MAAISKTYVARNKAKARTDMSSTTTLTNSDRKMRAVTSHKILNADWLK